MQTGINPIIRNSGIYNLYNSKYIYKKLFCFVGASASNPDLLFVLPQKVSKKGKTAPASLEKLTLSWLKPSKLAPLSLKQDSFLRQLHLFFGSPDEVAR